MKIFSYIIPVFSFYFFSCGNAGKTETDLPATGTPAAETPFNWPQGKYIYVNNGGMYFEEWTKGDSGIYKGAAFFINQKSNDTLFSTSLKLQRKKDKTILYYVAKGQNNTKDVEFTLTKEDHNLFVFENPFRDFPSILQYKILGDSAIEVTERGFVNNHEQVKEYKVKKIN